MKQVAAAPMPEIESDRMACQKPPHNTGDRDKLGAEQQMKMIGHQGPCKTAGLAVPQDTAQPLQKVVAIPVVPENLPPLDASRDDMVQGSQCI